MHVVIDLVNGDEIIIGSDPKKKEEKKEPPLVDRRQEKIVRKQVININGEIIFI